MICDGASTSTRTEWTLTAATGWCAPSSTNYELVTDCELPSVPTWWTDVWVPSAEQKLRWAVDDAWLRRQLRLCIE